MDGPDVISSNCRVQTNIETATDSRFIGELLGYGVASAAALAIDVAILKLLVDHGHWHYLWAATLSFLVGTAVAYVLSLRLAFSSRRVSNGAVEFACFAALGVVGVGVNATAISLGIRFAGLSIVPAKLLAALCTFATNFTLRRVFLFSPKEVRL